MMMMTTQDKTQMQRIAGSDDDRIFFSLSFSFCCYDCCRWDDILLSVSFLSVLVGSVLGFPSFCVFRSSLVFWFFGFFLAPAMLLKWKSRYTSE